MRHLDEGTIHAWLDGALPADEAEYAARHSAECAECAAAVADARGLIAGASRIVSSLDVVRGGVIPPQPAAAAGSRSLWRMLHLTPARSAIAATLLLAVGSTFVLSSRSEKIVADTVTMASAAAAPAAPPLASSPSAPTVQRIVPSAGPAKRTERVQVPMQIPPAAVATATPPMPRVDSAQVAQAPSAPPAAEKVADRAAAANAAQLSETRRDLVQRAAGAGAQRFAQSMASMSAEACYRLLVDSTAWLRAIPVRFSLERDSASGPKVVRTVDANVRLDSLLAGGRWRQMPVRITSLERTSCRP